MLQCYNASLSCGCFFSPIVQACELYGHCVEELAAVERHLLQARARALAEREKRLSERKQALCGYEEGLCLPAGVLRPSPSA